MKKMLSLTIAGLFAGSLAFAVDAKNEQKTETDTSKNPITGTVVETTTSEQNIETPAGSKKVDVKKKKKTKTDGTVTEETTIDSDVKKEGQ